MRTLQQQAVLSFERNDYKTATQLYEQLIEVEPEVKSHYWYLGVLKLLQGDPAEAQAAWLTAMLDGDIEELERWNLELSEILEWEAQRQETREELSLASILRQQILEINPNNINNAISLLHLILQLGTYREEELIDVGIVELLTSESSIAVNFEQLLSVIQEVFKIAPFDSSSLDLVAASLHLANSESQMVKMLTLLLGIAVDIGGHKRQPRIAAQLCEIVLDRFTQQPDFIYHLASFYQDSEQYEKGIETAKLYLSLVEDNLIERIIANKAILRSLMVTGGHWQEARQTFEKHRSMLQTLVECPEVILDSIQISRLFNSLFFAPYIDDLPKENRTLQNQVAIICQQNRQSISLDAAKKYSVKFREKRLEKIQNRVLKIGYLSSCLKSHSVGWLARWLFKYANRKQFELYAYMITSQNSHNFLQDWYIEQVNQAYLSSNDEELAEQIYRDEIDILIDLDSITSDIACDVVSLKPAPIQVTWLGLDASGIPAIDYFIADPYVLPESAQDYYSEKIWRLPQTYIAVDGFEIEVPTLRRKDLEIEGDAIVYLSAQSGYKRHPDTVRLQLQIVKAVPNSYLAIKGSANLDAVQRSFYQIADEEGVERERLRFLQPDPSEPVHRANLTIADVVLDTYPYNGATTTLETLWMGIPLVTRVGEQFAARNSYTMMMNAGITEGIAWTDEEYVEWGIRLGKDEILRKEISWKLKKSRQTAPLWNGKQFTREMEKAYRAMWTRYIES
ncbi:O-linked N-acetylglucosamine transferase, SPINDLY family protein [Oscillatoria sp. FACHB-1406]|uniref:O-linked N-acetylglucosamine transferase, SPINDLY family protein n=1 Tax=Oscillatoria sp. FACHB-1406 TaxID=2692846 RepID=UPI00168836E1|nr:O-linked N-acetylglucosamine transferase, SPINDLY family protein [Oscillatoria sp. FACHB-1406]MBD2577310.1 O-linked N-acetylglucosamine transferase, SPINDLY family protein [Oscillatoria sp. FACHB-1406]